MDISIKSKEPLTLYTANKYCKENITLQVESEELIVTPSVQEQVYEGLFNKVITKGIESEEITIKPTTSEQVFNGLYNKVTVAGVDNSGGKITDTKYLFYNNARSDEVQNVLKCCIGVTSCESMFEIGTLFTGLNISALDISQVETTWRMFYGCTSLTYVTFGEYTADRITILGRMFYNCKKLKTVNLNSFDASNVINVNSMFYSCSALENLISFKNLGKGFAKIANNGDYTLNLSPCTKLTYDSLMSVINNLYDLNLTYDVANGGTLYTQSLVLGSTNKAKLTAEEIAIATNKGWIVS